MSDKPRKVFRRMDVLVNCERREGGRCVDGHYDGAAGGVVCRACPHRVPLDASKPATSYAEPRTLTIGEMAAGVMGVAMAVVNPADVGLVQARLKVCGACEHNRAAFGMIAQCDVCGCALAAKVRNADERCPDGRW